MNELCFMTNMSSADMAAWVQAIGSIAAVLAAFLVVHLQSRSAEKLRRAENAARFAAYFAVFSHVVSVVAEVEAKAAERIGSTNYEEFLQIRDRYTKIKERIFAFPLEGMPSGSLIDSFLWLSQELRTLDQAVSNTLMQIYLLPDRRAIENFVHELLSRRIALNEELQRIREGKA